VNPVPVPVPLLHPIVVAVQLFKHRVVAHKDRGPLAQPHRAAHLPGVVLGHVNHDGLGGGGVDLGSVGFLSGGT
jgi:hypothetical protein